MSDDTLKPQCPYVFDGGYCCDSGEGHAGVHTTNENALRDPGAVGDLKRWQKRTSDLLAELDTEEKKHAALRAALIAGRDKMRASGDHGPANWLTSLLGDA